MIRMHHISHVAAMFALSFVAAGLIGCSSGGRTSESEKAIDSLNNTRAELVKAKGTIDQAQLALGQLPTASDLAAASKNYSNAVENVHKVATRAKERADQMRSRQADYIANWEKEMENVSDPTIKASAEQRRAAVKAHFDAIRTDAIAVKDAYQPYANGLDQIKIALASDMTPAGVKSLKPAIDKTTGDGVILQKRLDALIQQLDEVRAGMAG